MSKNINHARAMSDCGFMFWKQINVRLIELENCHTGAHMVMDVVTGKYRMTDGSIAHSAVA